MQEEARERLIAMVRDCGNDIVRMQASFAIYLNQYLADFPDEKQLLLEAFEVGVPEKLIQHAGEPEYPRYLEKLGPRFAQASRRLDDECIWAVETWAIALGRTADYLPPEASEKIYPKAESELETPQEKMIATTSMAVIVALGGAIGCASAAMLLPVMLYSLGFYDSFETGGRITGQYKVKSEMEQIVLFAALGLIAGSFGGIAALGGWLYGQGAERPWTSFGVACGAAFTTFIFVAFMPIPLLIKPILLLSSVFAATYKSAARGGYY